VLLVEKKKDHIIFVDIKCGTLFGMDRDLVIEKGALTTHDGNKLDFTEAAKNSAAKDRILEAMKGSQTLGVSPQVVVTKMEVEDYDLQDAEAVQGVFGVSLKKRTKNKKGEEFIYVDPKTGASGELSRKKFITSKFITPMKVGKKEELQETEHNTNAYDKYITQIREVFGIRAAR